MNPAIERAVSEFSEGDLEGFNERAGIMEYEGGLTRGLAEAMAFRMMESAKRASDE